MVRTCNRAMGAFLIAGLGFLAAALSPEAGRSARDEIARITSEKLRSGESVVLTEDEINSLLRYDPPADIPEGVRDLRVRFHQDSAEVRTFVDMSKVQAANGGDPGFLVRMLLRGEREVRAKCRYTSGNGEGRVDVESVEIDGTRISGAILDWLISSYVAPNIPDFEPGKPMPLPHHLRQIRLEPGRAVAVAY